MITEQVRGYPDFGEQVQELVAAHRELEHEELLLALYYEPARDRPQDIYLFEVLEDFGANSVDAERQIFEVEGRSTADFPMQPDQRLHLVLTNPKELSVALREEWTAIRELRDAIRTGKYEVIYAEPRGERLLEALRE